MKAAIITHYYKRKTMVAICKLMQCAKAIENWGTRLNNFVLHQKRRCLVKFPSKKKKLKFKIEKIAASVSLQHTVFCATS